MVEIPDSILPETGCRSKNDSGNMTIGLFNADITNDKMHFGN